MPSEKETTTEKKWQDMTSAELAAYIAAEETRHKARMKHLRAVCRALEADGK